PAERRLGGGEDPRAQPVVGTGRSGGGHRGARVTAGRGRARGDRPRPLRPGRTEGASAVPEARAASTYRAGRRRGAGPRGRALFRGPGAGRLRGLTGAGACLPGHEPDDPGPDGGGWFRRDAAARARGGGRGPAGGHRHPAPGLAGALAHHRTGVAPGLGARAGAAGGGGGTSGGSPLERVEALISEPSGSLEVLEGESERIRDPPPLLTQRDFPSEEAAAEGEGDGDRIRMIFGEAHLGAEVRHHPEARHVAFSVALGAEGVAIRAHPIADIERIARSLDGVEPGDAVTGPEQREEG